MAPPSANLALIFGVILYKISVEKKVMALPKLATRFQKISVLSGVHRAMGFVFKRLGFRWEVHRSGDQKIGLWRKTYREAKNPNETPRRIVVVPGFGDTPLSWASVVGLLRPVLSRRYDEVVLVDFPGFCGFLSSERCFESVDLMIEALGDVLDRLSPHTLLGHSMGGWLSSLYASECGQGARPRLQRRYGYTGPERLILVAPSGIHSSDEAQEAFSELFGRYLREGVSVLRPHFFAKEPLWFRLTVPALQRMAEQGEIAQFIQSAGTHHLMNDRLKQIRAETWLVWGSQDTLVPTAGVHVWLRGLGPFAKGPARAVLLKGVGHSPQIESPAVTAMVLGKILWSDAPELREGRCWDLLAGSSDRAAGAQV